MAPQPAISWLRRLYPKDQILSLARLPYTWCVCGYTCTRVGEWDTIFVCVCVGGGGYFEGDTVVPRNFLLTTPNMFNYRPTLPHSYTALAAPTAPLPPLHRLHHCPLCPTAPLPHCPLCTAPLHHCAAAPLFHSTTDPLTHSTTPPLHRTTAPLNDSLKAQGDHRDQLYVLIT